MAGGWSLVGVRQLKKIVQKFIGKCYLRKTFIIPVISWRDVRSGRWRCHERKTDFFQVPRFKTVSVLHVIRRRYPHDDRKEKGEEGRTSATRLPESNLRKTVTNSARFGIFGFLVRCLTVSLTLAVDIWDPSDSFLFLLSHVCSRWRSDGSCAISTI